MRRGEVTGIVGAKTGGRNATLDVVQAIVRRLSIVVRVQKILANQKPWVTLPSAKMSGKQKAGAKAKEMSQEGMRNAWFCWIPSLNLS